MNLEPLPIPSDPNPYQVLGSRPVYEGPWLRLREDRFRHRRGAEGSYAVAGFHHSACGVVAVDAEDRVVLVGQWRYPLGRYSWELPEGGGLPTETPFEAIRRELREETGLEARIWEPLAYFNPSNSTTDEEAFLFLANHLREAEGGHAPEADEELRVHREPLVQCLARVLAGEITDSLTVVGLLALRARRSGQAGALGPALAERFFQRPAELPALGRARWAGLSEGGAP